MNAVESVAVKKVVETPLDKLIESIASTIVAEARSPSTSKKGRQHGSAQARRLVETNFGKKHHRRGWCSL